MKRTQSNTPTTNIPGIGDRKLSHERQNSPPTVRNSEETDTSNAEKDRLKDREMLVHNGMNMTPDNTNNNPIIADKTATESRDDLEQPSAVTPTSHLPPVLSEKARGKLPMRSLSTLSVDPPGVSMGISADSAILGYYYDGNIGSNGPGLNGFVATEEWVQSWVKGLPIDSILIAIAEVSLQGLYESCLKTYRSCSFFPNSKPTCNLPHPIPVIVLLHLSIPRPPLLY